MHLHLPVLNCLTNGPSAPPLSYSTITLYRRLPWTHSQSTFELNCTLNKINEILVSGGLNFSMSVAGLQEIIVSWKVRTMNNHAAPSHTPASITVEKLEGLTCVSSGGGQCVRLECTLWHQSHYQKESSLIQADFYLLLYFLRIKGQFVFTQTSPLLLCVWDGLACFLCSCFHFAVSH